jgi:hypothetical protein
VRAGYGQTIASHSIFLGRNAGNNNNQLGKTDFQNNLVIDQSILSTGNPRTSATAIRENALLYGTFADATADQQLTINAENITLNGDALIKDKLWFNDNTNGAYFEYIGGENKSVGLYNSSGGFTTLEVKQILYHTFETDLTDEEAYNLVKNVDENNKSSWGACYVSKQVKDESRPEIEYYEEEVCTIPKEDYYIKECSYELQGELYQRVCTDVLRQRDKQKTILEDYYETIYNNETGELIGYELNTREINITADPICETQTFSRTIYPHTKLSESLDAECMQVILISLVFSS